MVFGPTGAAAAAEYDEALAKLKLSFRLPQREPDPRQGYPPSLRPNADRAEVSRLLDTMAAAAGELTSVAPTRTLLDPERLERSFLEPMRAELAVAQALSVLKRPEDWWPEHEATCLALLSAGDEQSLAAACAETRPRIETELAAMSDALGGVLRLEAYHKLWQERAEGGVEYLRAELGRRAEALARRIEALSSQDLDAATMMGTIDSPPAGGRVVAEVSVTELVACPVQCSGAWLAGPYPADRPRAFVMSFPGKTASAPGDLCQVAFSLPVPQPGGNPKLQLHLTDEYDSDRWTGYRFYQLLHADQVVWEEDIARTRRGGGEWSEVDVSGLPLAKGMLSLTLRMLDKRAVANYPTTVFLGPVRLVAEP